MPQGFWSIQKRCQSYQGTRNLIGWQQEPDGKLRNIYNGFGCLYRANKSSNWSFKILLSLFLLLHSCPHAYSRTEWQTSACLQEQRTLVEVFSQEYYLRPPSASGCQGKSGWTVHLLLQSLKAQTQPLYPMGTYLQSAGGTHSVQPWLTLTTERLHCVLENAISLKQRASWVMEVIKPPKLRAFHN